MLHNFGSFFLCFRGESLDNLESPRSSSWRQAPWLNQSAGVHASSSVQDFSRPPPQLLSTSNRAYMRNPSSSIPAPSAGPGKAATAPSPTPRGQVPSAAPSGSQLRNRWGPFWSSFLSFRCIFSLNFFPNLVQAFQRKPSLFECVKFSVLLSDQLRGLSILRAFMDVWWSVGDL